MPPKDSWVWSHEVWRRVGRDLRRRRKVRGLNQEQVAARIRVSPGTIHNIEHAKTKPDIEHLAAYAKVVGITIAQLLPEVGAPRTTDRVRATFLGRTLDTVAEEIAHDLLRDPTFRAEMQQLIRAAFQQTLQELHAPPKEPPDGK